MPNKTTRPLSVRPVIARTARAFGLKRTHVVASALGYCLFGSAPASALELGEASLRSGLGQSLVVEIPYRLAANEQLTPSCISLVPARGNADALPVYTQVRRVSLSPSHIQILGEGRVREPLIGLNVDIRCPTVPRFLRSYQLLVDLPSRTFDALPGATREAVTPEPAAIAAVAPTTTTRSAGDPSPRARGRAGGEIAPGQAYRVVRGDTLSGIAARVAGRPGTIRETADAVFAANPDAFAHGDRNRLEAGRTIVIPFMASSGAQPLADAPSALAPQNSEAPATADPVPAIETAPTTVEPLPSAEPLPAATAAAEPSAAPAPALDAADAALAPVSVPADATPTAPTAAWLAPLLALGGLLLLSAPLALLRRRRTQPTASEARRAPSQAPRPPIDSVAGIEVVEAQLPPTSGDTATLRTPATAETPTATAAAASPTVEIERPGNPIDSVDLDVGVPVTMEERVDWFGQRAAAAGHTVVADETVEENAATARVPDLDRTATASAPPAATAAAPVDEETMTLTVAELDMLREDYETEHTLTQAASKPLQEAVADLEATKASLAAVAETAELPQTLSAATVTARVRAR